jgi:hypothetical protein
MPPAVAEADPASHDMTAEISQWRGKTRCRVEESRLSIAVFREARVLLASPRNHLRRKKPMCM